MSLHNNTLICASQYHIEKFLEQIGTDDTVEIHTFFADELNLMDLSNLAFTHSLFYESKLIIIHKLELLKKLDELAGILNRGAVASFIITTSDEKKFAAAQKLLPGFIAVNEMKKSSADNTGEIVALFKSKNLSMNKQVASKFLEMLPDMNLIKVWADKFELFFHDKQHKPEDLLDFVSSEPQGKVFGFLDRFMERDKTGCMLAYHNQNDIKNSSVQIISMLSTYIGALYFKLTEPSLNNAKNPFFKGSMYFMRSVDANHKRWKTREAAVVIEQLAEMDLYIKTGRISSTDALIHLISLL